MTEVWLVGAGALCFGVCHALYAQNAPSQIRLVGNTVIPQEEVNAVLAPFQNKPVSAEQLRIVAEQLTKLYVEEGFVTSRVVVSADNSLRAVEGKLERVRSVDKVV